MEMLNIQLLKIYRVKYKINNETYILKDYKKDRVIEMRALFSIMNEIEFYKKNNFKSK